MLNKHEIMDRSSGPPHNTHSTYHPYTEAGHTPQYNYPGIRTALGLNRPEQKASASIQGTKIEFRPWHGISPEIMKPRRVYRSPQREGAAKISGWFSGSGSDNTELSNFANELETNGEFIRAATISLFCLNLRLCLQILNRGSQFYSQENKPELSKGLKMIAMTLSGFTQDKSGLWHEMMSDTGHESLTDDPYLQILFKFLLLPSESSSESEAYEYNFIMESDLSLLDKFAFATLHFNDSKLRDLIETRWTQLFDVADLRAVFLCGMKSLESVELLQRYLDFSGDVQTVSWLSAKYLINDYALRENVQIWMDSYRNLLNMWSQWNSRAEFDIVVNARPSIINRMPKQVYVSCNFCGRCVGQHVKSPVPKTVSLQLKQQQMQLMKNARLQACPACRKPLPRCAVCLINLGSLAGLNIQNEVPNPKTNKKLTRFQNFFTWCQSCRHGGHAKHLLEWFKDSNECPVSGCNCKCSSLDSASVNVKDYEQDTPSD